MVRVTVLYPNESAKRFDHDYYASKHLPMVMERLKGSGMLRYEVDKGLAGGGPGGARHRSLPLVICTSMPPPISKRGSTPTARRSWATFPTTQISHHRSRLVRSS
jgi:hypothetical protein